MGKAIKNFRRGVEGDDEVDVTPPEKQVGEASGAGEAEEGDVDAETGEGKSESRG
jgi:hypothetical protein